MYRESLCRLVSLLLATQIFFALSVERPCCAQPGPPSPARDEENNGVENPNTGALPQTYYLRDEDGNLVPVLDWNYEDFQQLHLREQEGNASPPSYALTSVRASGRVVDDRADLNIIISVQIRDTGWIRIPLGMTRGLLREEVEFSEAEDHFVVFDEVEGYIAWIKAPVDDVYRLVFPLTVAVEKQGDETKLQIDLPRATANQLELEVSGPQVVAQVSGRATLQETLSLDDGYVKLSVLGAVGEFELSWRPQRTEIDVEEIAIEITSRTLVLVRDQNKISSEIELAIRPYGGLIDTIVVQIPKEAQLLESNETDFALSILPADPQEPAESSMQRVQVRLARPTENRFTIRLATEISSGNPTDSSLLEAGGFYVENGVRVSGHIAVAVEDDWYVSWDIDDSGGAIRRVDILPESLQQSNVVAGFEYFRQPFSLPLRIFPKQSRIRVSPTYTFHIEGGDILLTAHLPYEVRGAKAYFLTVDLAEGWQIDSVGPESLVKQNSIVPQRDGPLIIGLDHAMAGDFEIMLKARRSFPADANMLVLPLLQPKADVIEPALVVVDAAESIRLTVGPSDLRGWTRDVLPDDFDEPLLGRNPLVYRVRGEGASAEFHAELFRLHQEVDVRSSTRIDLAEDRFDVRHDMTIQVLHEPLERITLEAPRTEWEEGRLHFSLDGEPIEPTILESATSPNHRIALQIAIVPPRTGTVVVTAVTSIAAESSSELSVGLLSPIGLPVAGHEVHVTTVEDWGVSVNDSAWQTDVSVDSETEHRYETAEPVESFDFSIRRDAGRTERPLMVDRAWVQTWIAGSTRQDRAVFQIYSDGEPIRIRLPGEIFTESLVVLVDGRRITPEVNDSVLTLRLGSASSDLRRGVEITYRMRANTRRRNFTFQLPVLLDAVDAKRTLWQLIMPGDKLGQLRSSDWTSEQRWGWRGWRYGGLPTWTQTDLEAWSGGSQQTPPPEGAGTLVYSHLGKIDQIEMMILGRTWLFIAIAGSLLAFGLLVIYVRAIRRIEIGLAIAAALIAAGLIYPEPTFMAVQWAAWGLLFSGIALAMRWSLGRRLLSSGVIHGTTRSTIDSHSTHSHRPPRDGSSQSSTQTAPLLATLPGSEVKP